MGVHLGFHRREPLRREVWALLGLSEVLGDEFALVEDGIGFGGRQARLEVFPGSDSVSEVTGLDVSMELALG